MRPRFLCLLLLLALLPTGCGGKSHAAPAKRVLFIGNSLTFVNDLPAVFTQLAKGGGFTVATGVEQIREVHAEPLLFEAWGRSAGWPERNLFGYDAMQLQAIAASTLSG
jgi:hypothetical protein